MATLVGAHSKRFQCSDGRCLVPIGSSKSPIIPVLVPDGDGLINYVAQAMQDPSVMLKRNTEQEQPSILCKDVVMVPSIFLLNNNLTNNDKEFISILLPSSKYTHLDKITLEYYVDIPEVLVNFAASNIERCTEFKFSSVNSISPLNTRNFDMSDKDTNNDTKALVMSLELTSRCLLKNMPVFHDSWFCITNGLNAKGIATKESWTDLNSNSSFDNKVFINILVDNPDDGRIYYIDSSTAISFVNGTKEKDISALNDAVNNLELKKDIDNGLSLPPEMCNKKPFNELTSLEIARLSILEMIYLPKLIKCCDKLENFKHLAQNGSGFLLQGPPGVGKTYLVRTICKDVGIPLVLVDGSQVFGSYPGETEENIRNKFKEALSLAYQDLINNKKKNIPDGCCILFLDEIDSLAPKRSGQIGTGSQPTTSGTRTVAQLLVLMDGFSRSRSEHMADIGKIEDLDNCRIIVVAATNRPNALDEAIRRPGRLDKEIAISTPSYEERKEFLFSNVFGKTLLKEDLSANYMPLIEKIDDIAARTSGFVRADLTSLISIALQKELDNFNIDAKPYNVLTPISFEYALTSMGTSPSILRGVDGNINSLDKQTFNDIVGMKHSKEMIMRRVVLPLKSALSYSDVKETSNKLGLKPPSGLLLYGPPGNAKTSLVKALGNELRFKFFSLSPGQVYSPFVGDSEAKIRDTFRLAREVGPSIIFFDEIDALVSKRGLDGKNKGSTSSTVSERILSTLLNEMDGIENTRVNKTVGKGFVFVVGATNRKNALDEALIRSDRMEIHLEIPNPSQEELSEILEFYLKKYGNHCVERIPDVLASGRIKNGASCKAVGEAVGLQLVRGELADPLLAALTAVGPSEN